MTQAETGREVRRGRETRAELGSPTWCARLNDTSRDLSVSACVIHNGSDGRSPKSAENFHLVSLFNLLQGIQDRRMQLLI